MSEIDDLLKEVDDAPEDDGRSEIDRLLDEAEAAPPDYAATAPALEDPVNTAPTETAPTLRSVESPPEERPWYDFWSQYTNPTPAEKAASESRLAAGAAAAEKAGQEQLLPQLQHMREHPVETAGKTALDLGGRVAGAALGVLPGSSAIRAAGPVGKAIAQSPRLGKLAVPAAEALLGGAGAAVEGGTHTLARGGSTTDAAKDALKQGAFATAVTGGLQGAGALGRKAMRAADTRLANTAYPANVLDEARRKAGDRGVAEAGAQLRAAGAADSQGLDRFKPLDTEILEKNIGREINAQNALRDAAEENLLRTKTGGVAMGDTFADVNPIRAELAKEAEQLRYVKADEPAIAAYTNRNERFTTPYSEYVPPTEHYLPQPEVPQPGPWAPNEFPPPMQGPQPEFPQPAFDAPAELPMPMQGPEPAVPAPPMDAPNLAPEPMAGPQPATPQPPMDAPNLAPEAPPAPPPRPPEQAPLDFNAPPRPPTPTPPVQQELPFPGQMEFPFPPRPNMTPATPPSHWTPPPEQTSFDFNPPPPMTEAPPPSMPEPPPSMPAPPPMSAPPPMAAEPPMSVWTPPEPAGPDLSPIGARAQWPHPYEPTGYTMDELMQTAKRANREASKAYQKNNFANQNPADQAEAAKDVSGGFRRQLEREFDQRVAAGHLSGGDVEARAAANRTLKPLLDAQPGLVKQVTRAAQKAERGTAPNQAANTANLAMTLINPKLALAMAGGRALGKGAHAAATGIRTGHAIGQGLENVSELAPLARFFGASGGFRSEPQPRQHPEIAQAQAAAPDKPQAAHIQQANDWLKEKLQGPWYNMISGAKNMFGGDGEETQE